SFFQKSFSIIDLYGGSSIFAKSLDNYNLSIWGRASSFGELLLRGIMFLERLLHGIKRKN
ncbi:MAG: hypothetical protein KKD56_09330, partial [Acidobacteria bacterium]|nr:hypothetical protein [Acidobacteriota bacterium]